MYNVIQQIIDLWTLIEEGKIEANMFTLIFNCVYDNPANIVNLIILVMKHYIYTWRRVARGASPAGWTVAHAGQRGT